MTKLNFTFPTVLLEGTPRARGRQHGEWFREEIAAPDFYTYSARFVPDDAAADTFAENNEATAFTHVRGRGQVLLVPENPAMEPFDMDPEGRILGKVVAVLRRL